MSKNINKEQVKQVSNQAKDYTVALAKVSLLIAGGYTAYYLGIPSITMSEVASLIVLSLTLALALRFIVRR